MRDTRQSINVDASGQAFMVDGTKVNQLTLRALVKKQALVPCGTDLFGEGVTAYRISEEAKAA
ncbi:hypothetical protein BKP64_10780 [Marinobacter salinus]|uniref:Uncharacterized protein n=1 Tax=Marinobacter salinus TaxID=1874317 RepID=A0A1D9GLU7_9GAMM|nr:hypothetical protein [Marinobacter salinus]AOY88612.1 hypothetical protein BKP64_10780 [Marinobacter salinus]